MSNERVIASLIAALVAIVPVEATTVLAIRHGDRILLAADSLRIGTTADNSKTAFLACKVRNYGDIVYTAAGDYRLPIFSPDALAEHLLRQNETESVRDRITRFTREAKTAFSELHNARERSDDLQFTYVLGFFEGGAPVVLMQRFASTEGRMEFEDREEIEHNRLVWAGQAGSSSHEQLVGRTFQSEEYPAMFDEIIRIQARVTPNAVRGPADIIQLTADGATWIQSKPKCRKRE